MMAKKNSLYGIDSTHGKFVMPQYLPAHFSSQSSHSFMHQQALSLFRYGCVYSSKQYPGVLHMLWLCVISSCSSAMVAGLTDSGHLLYSIVQVGPNKSGIVVCRYGNCVLYCELGMLCGFPMPTVLVLCIFTGFTLAAIIPPGNSRQH